ncbi:MAG: hypothetical protein VXZ39_08965 [Planctomycetota bacterium]|nr:hypothetical protein [Planctomycetota bacterium]
MKGIEGGAAREVRDAQAPSVSTSLSSDLTAVIGPARPHGGTRPRQIESAGGIGPLAAGSESRRREGGADPYPAGALVGRRTPPGAVHL